MEYIKKCKAALASVFNDDKKIKEYENEVCYLEVMGNTTIDNEPQGVMCKITDKNIIVQSIADYSNIGYEKIKITLPLDCNEPSLQHAIRYCANETKYFLENINIYGVGFVCYDLNTKNCN